MKEITVDAMIENMNTVTAFVDDFLDQCDSFADGKKSAHEQRFSVVRRTGSLIGGMTG